MIYTSIKLPIALADEIRKIIDKKGFTSVSDFVLFATRIQLKEESKTDTNYKKTLRHSNVSCNFSSKNFATLSGIVARIWKKDSQSKQETIIN